MCGTIVIDLWDLGQWEWGLAQKIVRFPDESLTMMELAGD
jgi:hypothetical protein